MVVVVVVVVVVVAVVVVVVVVVVMVVVVEVVVVVVLTHVAGQTRHVGAEGRKAVFECKFLAGRVRFNGGEGSQGLNSSCNCQWRRRLQRLGQQRDRVGRAHGHDL